jgi:hypothetical protein
LFPGKRFKLRGGLTPEERQTALIWHDMLDVTQGWENVIAMSERFSDDDTAITKYSQGTDASHLNNTATGISMIMNAASLPMKEVIQNIDEMWIERAIEALIDWNMQNLEPEAVQVLLGDKTAQAWAEVRQFGKTSFMKWKATGSSTFMMKEILMQKLQGFLQLVSSNPATASMVDLRELLEQVWEAGEIGRESPIYDEETLASKKQENGPPPEMLQAMQQMQQQLEQAQAQLRGRENDLQLQMARIAADERIRMAELAIKDRDSRVNAEKILADTEQSEAKTDLTQAQTAQVLAETGLALTPAVVQTAETQQATDE